MKEFNFPYNLNNMKDSEYKQVLKNFWNDVNYELKNNKVIVHIAVLNEEIAHQLLDNDKDGIQYISNNDFDINLKNAVFETYNNIRYLHVSGWRLIYEKFLNTVNFFSHFHHYDNKQINATISYCLEIFGSLNFFCEEFDVREEETIKQNDFKNVNFFMNGFVNFELKNANVIYYPSFKLMFKYIYNRGYNKTLLESTNPYQDKPYYFEALLGSLKDRKNRLFLVNQIENSNFFDKNIIKYFKVDNKFTNKENISNNFELEPGTIILLQTKKSSLEELDQNGSMTLVKFNNKITAISFIIPFTIYKKTAYSIIAETNCKNSYTQLTEKTFKPIITKRLFIAFCGKGFLKNLKKIGFLTFNNIIDESYDDIENDQERWDAAFKQVKFLMEQEQSFVLKKIKPIVEHNFKLFMSDDFDKKIYLKNNEIDYISLHYNEFK